MAQNLDGIKEGTDKFGYREANFLQGKEMPCTKEENKQQTGENIYNLVSLVLQVPEPKERASINLCGQN